MLAALAGLIAVYFKPTWLRAALVAAAALTYVSDPGSAADFVRQFVIGLIFVSVAWWGIVKVMRFNLLGYFLLFACPVLLAGGVELYKQPNSGFRRGGVFCFAALGLLLLWPLISWRRSGAAAIPGAPPPSGSDA